MEHTVMEEAVLTLLRDYRKRKRTSQRLREHVDKLIKGIERDGAVSFDFPETGPGHKVTGEVIAALERKHGRKVIPTYDYSDYVLGCKIGENKTETITEKAETITEKAVAQLKAYGQYIVDHAENIIGDIDDPNYVTEEGITVSFVLLEHESVPTVEVTKNHVAIDAFPPETR